jgi:amino acid transporter
MSAIEKDQGSQEEKYLEKGEGGPTQDYVVPVVEDRYKFDQHDLDRVQRRLKQRHVQMIAIAGTIGTGLFLGSGAALRRAGPLGALLGYIHVASVAYSSLCAVGEMTSFAPISGTFPHYAARFVDPAFGFAVGWNYFYTNLVTIPGEINAAVLILSFWDPDEAHIPAYTAVLVVCCSLINVFGVRWFGESEFFFSIIKLCLITGLIITGLVIDLGGGPNHQRTGFYYWQNPGALNTYLIDDNVPLGRFLAIIGVLVQAAFSFQGMELVAIAASETESPRRNIAKAVRRVFYRILFFYLLGILVTGMLVPYNDERLLANTGNAAMSPYVIAIEIAGIQGLPHLINACVFTSAFSATNSFLFCASRILYGLALRGQAPKIFSRCTQSGLPLISVIFCACFGLLSFMSLQATASTVFGWFVSLSTVGGFIAWWSINLTYLFFYRGMKVQGIDRKQLVYWSALQPYLSMWGVFWTTIFTLINGFDVFFDFTASGFISSYINLPLFIILWVGWHFIKKTRFWKPEEIDFVTGIPSLEETEIPEEPPRHIWDKIFNILF